MASAEQLVSEGRIERARGAAKLSGSLLPSAKSDLKAARDNLKLGNPEWAFRMCRSSAFNASAYLMSRYGYRPTREEDLQTAFEFFQSAEPEIAKLLSPLLSEKLSPKAAIEAAEKFLNSLEQ